MKVCVTQSINCSHQLPGTEIHGHTYRITAMYSGVPDDSGMAMPLHDLSAHLRGVLVGLDHLQLEIVIGSPATAERLAEYIKAELSIPCQIRVFVGDEGYVETE